MAKKVVLEVEGYTKVLNFVSGLRISTPGIVEVFTILNEATLLDITITEKTEEVPPAPPSVFTEQDPKMTDGSYMNWGRYNIEKDLWGNKNCALRIDPKSCGREFSCTVCERYIGTSKNENTPTA